MPNLRSPFRPGFDRQAAVELATAVKAIADPTRLLIIHLLHTRQASTVLDLTPHLGISQPTVSHHLRVMEAAGLVTSQDEGVFKPRTLSYDLLGAVAIALRPRGVR
jgi:ArsR family transcriptional regulator